MIKNIILKDLISFIIIIKLICFGFNCYKVRYDYIASFVKLKYTWFNLIVVMFYSLLVIVYTLSIGAIIHFLIFEDKNFVLFFSYFFLVLFLYFLVQYFFVSYLFLLSFKSSIYIVLKWYTCWFYFIKHKNVNWNSEIFLFSHLINLYKIQFLKFLNFCNVFRPYFNNFNYLNYLKLSESILYDLHKNTFKAFFFKFFEKENPKFIKKVSICFYSAIKKKYKKKILSNFYILKRNVAYNLWYNIFFICFNEVICLEKYFCKKYFFNTLRSYSIFKFKKIILKNSYLYKKKKYIYNEKIVKKTVFIKIKF